MYCCSVITYCSGGGKFQARNGRWKTPVVSPRSIARLYSIYSAQLQRCSQVSPLFEVFCGKSDASVRDVVCGTDTKLINPWTELYGAYWHIVHAGQLYCMYAERTRSRIRGRCTPGLPPSPYPPDRNNTFRDDIIHRGLPDRESCLDSPGDAVVVLPRDRLRRSPGSYSYSI